MHFARAGNLLICSSKVELLKIFRFIPLSSIRVRDDREEPPVPLLAVCWLYWPPPHSSLFMECTTHQRVGQSCCIKEINKEATKNDTCLKTLWLCTELAGEASPALIEPWILLLLVSKVVSQAVKTKLVLERDGSRQSHNQKLLWYAIVLSCKSDHWRESMMIARNQGFYEDK